jgi:hypothetical protein
MNDILFFLFWNRKLVGHVIRSYEKFFLFYVRLPFSLKRTDICVCICMLLKVLRSKKRPRDGRRMKFGEC